jgi:hypothetical protein
MTLQGKIGLWRGLRDITPEVTALIMRACYQNNCMILCGAGVYFFLATGKKHNLESLLEILQRIKHCFSNPFACRRDLMHHNVSTLLIFILHSLWQFTVL